jgi:hypothetical protein
MKVAWIVTDAKKRPQEIVPWIEGRPFSGQPDFSYYADRVAQTLARVTEVYDWDADALLRGSHQKRLGAGPSTPRTSDPDEAVTLDTPVTEVAKAPARRQTTL